MPQPITKVRTDASIILNSIGDRFLGKQAAVAVLALEALVAWTQVESFMLDMFITLAGGDDADAAAVFLAMETASAKSAAITALAERKLSEENLRLLRAIIKVVKSAEKERNKLAHWTWGWSPQIQNAFLLSDPRNLKFEKDKVFVFTADDFSAMIARFERIAGWGLTFKFILMGHVANREGQLFDELCREPEIAGILNRQAQQG